MLTEDQLETLVMFYAEYCGGAGDEKCFDGCPWNSEANDVACAAFVIDAARHPECYELRDGLVEPTGWKRSSELPAFPRPAKCPQEATESRLSRAS